MKIDNRKLFFKSFPLLEILIFLFFSTMLILDRSANALSILIFLLAMALIYSSRSSLQDRDLKLLFLVLFLNLLLVIVAIIFNEGELSILKKPIKMLLFLPLVMLIMHQGLNLNYLRIGLATGMVLAAMFASWQYYYQGLARPGIHYNPQVMGWISAASFSLLLSFCVGKRTRWSLLYIIGAIASIICVILSSSRGSLLAIMPAAIFLIWWGWKQGLVKYLFSHYRVTSFIIVTLVLVTTVVVGVAFKKRISLAIDQSVEYAGQGKVRTSIGLRLEAWRGALIAVREHPFLGVGSSDARQKFIQEKINLGELDPAIKRLKHTHSDYFDALQSKGIPGLLVQLLIYFVPLLIFYRDLEAKTETKRVAALSGVLLVISYATISLTDMPLRHSLSSTFFWMTIAILIGYIRYSPPPSP